MTIPKENNAKEIKDETFTNLIIGFTVGLLSALVIGAIITTLIPTPTLMGIGCENTSGPIFAIEEDHFPFCLRIESL